MTPTVQFVIFCYYFFFVIYEVQPDSVPRCLTSYSPILIGSALALSKTKNCVVYLTTPHSPARSVNLHSLDTSLHHAVKSLVFCKLQSYGASSQEGLPCTDFSPPHPTEKYLDRLKWSLTTFYAPINVMPAGGGGGGPGKGGGF